jgi:hypothetical protein
LVDETDPVYRLVMAVMLASIRKDARAVRVVTTSPMRVFFDFGDTCVEEMRPPERLRTRVTRMFAELSGLDEFRAARFSLHVNDATYEFEATLSRDNTVFRIARVRD